jgi:hypothetical protein
MNDTLAFSIGLGISTCLIMIAAAFGQWLTTPTGKDNTMATKKLIYNKGEVVGSFYLQAQAKAFAEQVANGTPVTIQRGADNPHDGYACRVMTVDGQPLGYIPGCFAPAVALFADNGFAISGEVSGHIGKRSMGNQPRNPMITLYAEK